MKRRSMLALVATGPLSWAGLPAHAHHGWSSFDNERPLYLEGRAAEVKWRNPHAELVLELASPLSLPADLRSRSLPPQQAAVDSAHMLGKTALPVRRDRRWTIELAPLTRMTQWQVPQIVDGAALAVIGFTFAGERGDAVLRAEYLFLGGKAYGMRSSPA